MIKSIKILLVTLLVSFAAKAQDKGIQFFHGSWAEAKAEAKKQNMPLFVDCYTTWCGPCKRMAETVFTRSEVGGYYNRNFVNYQLDMEKGDGPAVAKEYDIRFYPTFLFFNANGELIHKTLGAKSALEFINDAKTAMDPNANLTSLINRFNNGEKDTTLLHKLIVKTNDLDPAIQEKALKAYFSSFPPSDIEKIDTWILFNLYYKDIQSPVYKYVLENREKLATRYPKEAIDQALYTKAAEALQKGVESKNDSLYYDARNVLLTSKDTETIRVADFGAAMFAKAHGDWNGFVKAGDAFMKKYTGTRSFDMIANQLALEAVNGSDSKSVLKHALNWSKLSIKADSANYNLSTYAQIQYKLANYELAEKAALRSIEMAKAAKEDYQSTEELLEKIREKLKK